jgi:hypothetical protein
VQTALTGLKRARGGAGQNRTEHNRTEQNRTNIQTLYTTTQFYTIAHNTMQHRAIPCKITYRSKLRPTARSPRCRPAGAPQAQDPRGCGGCGWAGGRAVCRPQSPGPTTAPARRCRAGALSACCESPTSCPSPLGSSRSHPIVVVKRNTSSMLYSLFRSQIPGKIFFSTKDVPWCGMDQLW